MLKLLYFNMHVGQRKHFLPVLHHNLHPTPFPYSGNSVPWNPVPKPCTMLLNCHFWQHFCTLPISTKQCKAGSKAT